MGSSPSSLGLSPTTPAGAHGWDGCWRWPHAGLASGTCPMPCAKLVTSLVDPPSHRCGPCKPKPCCLLSSLPLHPQLHARSPFLPPASQLSPSLAGAGLALWLGTLPGVQGCSGHPCCHAFPKLWVACHSLPVFPSTSLMRANRARAEPPKLLQQQLPWRSFPLRCIRLVTS